MKTTHWIMIGLTLSLIGCAGGDVGGSGTTAGSKYSSAAPVEFLPYEILRNNIISGFQLSASSECIKALDRQRDLFGAQSPGGLRSLGFSITRQKATTALGDECCRQGIKDNPDLLLNPDDPLDMSIMGRAIYGRPLTDTDEEKIDDLLAISGYTSNAQRQHAACVMMFSSFKATVQ